MFPVEQLGPVCEGEVKDMYKKISLRLSLEFGGGVGNTTSETLLHLRRRVIRPNR